MQRVNKYTYVGITILVLGFLLSLYANATTYVQADGVLHETFATPLSVLLIFVGILVCVRSLFILRSKD